MISPVVFTNIIKRFANCTDRPVKKEQVDELYERLRFEDEATLTSAIEILIMDESKLTLPAIKHAIASSKKSNGVETRKGSHVVGEGCPNCDMGLIFTRRNGDIPYRYVYRCKCGSYDAPIIPTYNGDGIDEARI